MAAIEPEERARTYQEMIEQIRGINVLLKSVEAPPTTKGMAQKDWYQSVSKVTEQLMGVHGMEISIIQKYAVFHYLDKLSLEEKLVLLSNVPAGVEEGNELLVKIYLDDRRITAEEEGEIVEAILLANGSKNQLFVKGSDGWRESTYTDEQLFAAGRAQRFVVPKERIHRTEVGFMHPFKEKEIVFKMKDLSQKRNNTGENARTHQDKPSPAKSGLF